MADYVWPLAATPEKFALSLFSKTVRGTSMFGRNGQNLDMLNDRWKVDATIGKREPIEGAAVEAFINSMRGGVNTVQVPHFSRPRPLGTAQQSLGLLYAAPQGAKTVSIATFAGATLLTGDLFNVDGLLLQVAADCVADSSGVLVVPLVNRLRRAVAGLTRASTATYIDSSGILQTAGVNVPRFQGSTALLEPSGSNLLSQSQNLEAWSKGLVSVSLSTDQSPGAGVPAFWVVPDSTAGIHSLNRAPAVTAGTTYSYSFFGKSGELGRVAMLLGSAGFGTNTLDVFDLASGTVVTDASGSASIAPLSSGWYRCSATRVATASVLAAVQLRIYSNAGGTSWANDDVSGLWITGAQLEEAAGPTSYIPTGSVLGTRAADVVTPVILQNPTVKCRLAPGTIVAAPFGRGGNMTGVNFELVEAIP